MARVFGPPKPRSPRYKYEVADGVFVESIFPDFGTNVPMPERGRFKRQADPESGGSRVRLDGDRVKLAGRAVTVLRGELTV